MHISILRFNVYREFRKKLLLATKFVDYMYVDLSIGGAQSSRKKTMFYM